MEAVRQGVPVNSLDQTPPENRTVEASLEFWGLCFRYLITLSSPSHPAPSHTASHTSPAPSVDPQVGTTPHGDLGWKVAL